MNTILTHDETNLLCIYEGDTRRQTIRNLCDMRRHLMPEEADLLHLTNDVLRKLNQMTDDAYLKLVPTLFPDFETEG